MELLQVLFVTVVLAAMLSFVVSKFSPIVLGDDDHSGRMEAKSTIPEVDKGIVVEEKIFRGKLKGKSFTAERKVEPVDFAVEQVEEYKGEKLVQNEKIEGKLQTRGTEEREREYPQIEETKGKKKCRLREIEGIGESNARTVETRKIESNDHYEDDWEGIEKSEVETIFAAAAKFVASGDNMSNVGSDAQKELSALHKVATEGPCWEPQPMVLKFSARAKWNAWQRLGKMSPDLAMEQYVALLSNAVPRWMEKASIGDTKSGLSAEKTTCNSYSSMRSCSRSKTTVKRQLEIEPNIKGVDLVQAMNLGTEDMK